MTSFEKSTFENAISCISPCFYFFSLVLIVYVGEFDDSLTIMTTQHWLSEKRLKNILPMAVDKITEALKKSLNSLYQEMNDK